MSAPAHRPTRAEILAAHAERRHYREHKAMAAIDASA